MHPVHDRKAILRHESGIICLSPQSHYPGGSYCLTQGRKISSSAQRNWAFVGDHWRMLCPRHYAWRALPRHGLKKTYSHLKLASIHILRPPKLLEKTSHLILRYLIGRYKMLSLFVQLLSTIAPAFRLK